MPPDISPRIYCINPTLIDQRAWPRLLDHCIALGFDQVLVARDEHGLAGMDFSGVDLQALLDECATREVRVLVDLNLSRIDAGDALLQQHPTWFDPPQRVTQSLPDPRSFDRGQHSARMRWEDPQAAEAALTLWSQHLQTLTDSGVAGFVCRMPSQTPAAIWRRLIEPLRARHACQLMAWTPGIAAGQLTGLRQCHFDAVFGSGAWWDFRADWWVQEQDRLRLLAPALAFPEDPFGVRLARQCGLHDPDSLQRASLRALRFAAATGSGWLMPMGFEYGLQQSLFGGGQDADAYRQSCAQSACDFSHAIAQANRFVAATGSRYRGARLSMLSTPHAPLAQIERRLLSEPTLAPLLISVNSELHLSQPPAADFNGAFAIVPSAEAAADDFCQAENDLAPGALSVQLLLAQPPIITHTGRNKRAAQSATRAARIAIEAVAPVVDAGRFALKRIVGDTLIIEADILVDGHDHLAAQLSWRAADSSQWQTIPMQHLGNDRWRASLPLQRIGRCYFAIEAWVDTFGTFRDELEKKSRAGLELTLELEEGRRMIGQAAAAAADAADASALSAIVKRLTALKSGGRDKLAVHDAVRTEQLLDPECAALMQRAMAHAFAVRSAIDYPIDVERVAAGFSSWYELFPRSQSGDEHRHGTFSDVIARLPAIAAMGFDTVYFPPIHPIGRRNRKGRNNSLTADADDPGSPYAIGADEGGHDAIHPALGTADDFRALLKAAGALGLEVALDFAVQCAPDHPWLTAHPQWFAWRPDGSLRYAENPPKKYQDIVNVDFYADGAVPDLWLALRDVVLHWAGQGVRVFRVDNPHTKPLPFWEWLIDDIRGRYPDALFLAEAFTRPKMMQRLAKLGFSQSYTYFTWRHGKQELTDYLSELSGPETAAFFRPHFFVNTPDINPYFLQRSGRPGFLIRAALAATLSGLWGVYSGFELCEAQPLPGKEEYLDSEKFQLRAWDWQRPGNIVDEIAQLNRVRRANPALQTHTGLHFQQIGDSNMLAFVKATARDDGASGFGANVILIVINLDPFALHSGELELPLWQFGLPDDGVLAVEDLVHGHRFDWHGKFQTVTLDPHDSPYAIWRIRPQGH